MSTAIIEETASLLPRIAFIACGSFSPPTPMHLRLFEIARDHFEMQGTHKVVAGIISPTHDSYGKKGLASATDRFSMVKLALQSSNWVRVSDWEMSQSQWMRTKVVLQHHQNYMNNYINSPADAPHEPLLPSWLPLNLRECKEAVQLRLLCGADLLESFAVPGLWADEDIEDIVANHGLVVITRFGSNPEKFIFESDVLTKYQRNITLITNWVPNEVSSSMVRRLLNRGQSVKYLLDDRVLEYIQMKCLFNYKTKYITANLPSNQFGSHRNYNHSNNNNKNNNNNTSSELIVQLNNNNNRANHMQITPTTDTDDDLSESHMDETDIGMAFKSAADKRVPSVFCCGETPKLPKLLKLQLTRNGPGQAVQLVTTQIADNGTVGLQSTESIEYQPKKLKISQIQEV